MIDRLLWVPRLVAVRLAQARLDERGAISTETAIITAVVAIAAATLAGYIAMNVNDWQGEIPTP